EMSPTTTTSRRAQVIRRNAASVSTGRAGLAPTRAELSFTYSRRPGRPLRSYQAPAQCPGLSCGFAVASRRRQPDITGRNRASHAVLELPDVVDVRHVTARPPHHNPVIHRRPHRDLTQASRTRSATARLAPAIPG